MSATNSTPIINLPLFIGTDKPAWLTDWNGAMNTIDTAIAALQTAESGTATSLASLAQSVEALSGTVGQHTTALQTLTTAVSGNTGSINTINSLIGNGVPTTEDKTIIGAINEIYSEIGGGDGVAADDVTFDNTASDLQATNVQDAIDEIDAKVDAIPVIDDAGDVSYSNTTSGLTATDVQSAIDELAQGAGNTWTAIDTISHTGTTSQTTKTITADLTGYSEFMVRIKDSDNIICGSTVGFATDDKIRAVDVFAATSAINLCAFATYTTATKVLEARLGYSDESRTITAEFYAR